MASKIERAEFDRLATAVDGIGKSLQKHAVAFGKFEQAFTDSTDRLFGKSGQPGVIEKLYTNCEAKSKEATQTISAHVQEDEKSFGEINTKLTNIMGWRKSDKRVARVAVSIIVGEGALIGWLVHNYAAIAATFKAVAK